MRSVEEQLTLVTQQAVAPEPVRIAIAESLGLMCAEEVQAQRPLPGFDQAAIDGYAVRAVDVGGERGLGQDPTADITPTTEISLPVVRRSRRRPPADPSDSNPNQAVRVHHRCAPTHPLSTPSSPSPGPTAVGNA